jgi:hypothetical protein
MRWVWLGGCLLAVHHRSGRETIVMVDGKEGDTAIRTAADPMVKALARAFRWKRLLDDGR